MLDLMSSWTLLCASNISPILEMRPNFGNSVLFRVVTIFVATVLFVERNKPFLQIGNKSSFPCGDITKLNASTLKTMTLQERFF